MESINIRQNERVDDLNLGGLKLIQDPDQFCFGVDAVLLADHAAKYIKKGARVLDMCAGNGIVGVLLTHKSEAESIVGLEIQEAAASLAARNIKFNKLETRLEAVCGDLRNSDEIFGKSVFDNVVCNPPYKEVGSGIPNENPASAIARHEIKCTAEDVIAAGARLLRPGGKLSLIHRPGRLCDIIILMKKHKIEPKFLRFVHPSYKKTATMILITGVYCGNPQLKLLPPLYIHEPDGSGYTKEMDEIYERVKYNLCKDVPRL